MFGPSLGFTEYYVGLGVMAISLQLAESSQLQRLISLGQYFRSTLQSGAKPETRSFSFNAIPPAEA